jgi:hypothetical protein
VADIPDLEAIRARVEKARAQRPDSGIVRDFKVLLDHIERLQDALRDGIDLLDACYGDHSFAGSGGVEDFVKRGPRALLPQKEPPKP